MSFPSFFALLFAGGALRRRRALARWLPAFAFFLTTLLGSGMAQATVYTFAGGAVDTCTLSNKVYTCPYPAYLDWDDAVMIGTGYTLKVTNNVAVTYNQGLTMQAGSKLIVTGYLNLKDINPANLKVADNSIIEVGGAFSMGSLKQSLSADISAYSMNLGTDAITVNGNLTSTTSIAIGSYATINGNISGTVITTAAPVKITGKVTATTSFTLASGSTVTGTVDTGSLVLESSEALIDGPAYVNTARLEWHGRVSGIIYCKNGTAKNKCDCVTNNSGYAVNKPNGPTCEAPSPKTPHHFLITHDGEGDTCLPEKITVTACANAACTAPHYNGAASGTISGLNLPFSIAADTGLVAVNATRFTEGPVNLGVVDASYDCYRTSNNSNSCAMSFAGGAKLLVDIPDHVAGAGGISAKVKAVRANDEKTACIAAFADTTYNVQYSCSYSKPKTGSLPLTLGGQPLACAAGTEKSISTKFDANGLAPALSLKYPDSGELALKAFVDTKKGMTAKGEKLFVTVPAAFKLAPPAGPLRAGADFAVDVTALNADGATTPNFDTKDLNDAGGTGHDVALDVACRAQGGALGSFASSVSFTDGVAKATARWSEVGRIDLKASVMNFLGIANLNAEGRTDDPLKNCPGTVGPFLPQYFKLVIERPIDEKDRTFHYAQEPFVVRAIAMSKAGTITENYDAKIVDTVTKAAYSEKLTLSALGPTGVALAPAPGVLNTVPAVTPPLVEIPASAFVKGSAAVTVNYTFAEVRTAPQGMRLRATNGKAAPADVGSAYAVAPDPDPAKEAQTIVRSGRMRIGNRFGGLKTTLSIPVTVEYWTGKSWLLNADDSFTAIPPGSFALKPTVSGMAISPTFPYDPADPQKLVRFLNGTVAFDLRVTAGGPGPVEIAINLGGALKDNTCIGDKVSTDLFSSGANKPWLRPVVTGCGGTTARDPSGRATFGVYTPENRRIIHVREVFN